MVNVDGIGEMGVDVHNITDLNSLDSNQLPSAATRRR